MKTRLALLAVALIPQLSGCAPASLNKTRSPTPLTAGQRVRVHLRHLQPRVRTGRLLALSEDSIVLLAARDSQRVALPVAEFRGLEVSRGRKSYSWELAATGVAAGGLAVVFFVVPSHIFSGASGQHLRAAVRDSLLIGGGVGLFIGAAVPTERREDVSLRRLRGVRLGLGGSA